MQQLTSLITTIRQNRELSIKKNTTKMKNRNFRNVTIIPEEEVKWKRLFLELIRDEFYKTNSKLILDDSFKIKIALVFNWIVGKDIDVFENKGLYLFGDVGTGKSSILKATVRLLDLLYSNNSTGTIYVRYVTADEISRLYKENTEASEKKLNNIMTCQLLFIDDIGYEAAKVFDNYPVPEVVRERYDKKRITCFTSNYKPEQLIIKYGNSGISLEDKICEMCYLVEFIGDSKRN